MCSKNCIRVNFWFEKNYNFFHWTSLLLLCSATILKHFHIQGKWVQRGIKKYFLCTNICNTINAVRPDEKQFIFEPTTYTVLIKHIFTQDQYVLYISKNIIRISSQVSKNNSPRFWSSKIILIVDFKIFAESWLLIRYMFIRS